MHFAAWLSVGDSVRDPAGYYRNNVVGALSVLEAMVATGVQHFVFSSTAAVFGKPIETPITEDASDSGRSTPTARRSWRSSTRCRTTSAAYGLRRSRCATSTPPAPIPTASSARITTRRCT